MRFVILVSAFLILTACTRTSVQNPDPNHTHADVAVWGDGEKVDFSGEELMSHEEKHLHKHLHLHDGIGHVVHRHKPGLTLREFFNSLGFAFRTDRTWRMVVNGEEMEFDLGYVFSDMDQILLTTSSPSAQVLHELEQMTSDACLYSRTCPWRGDPPTENCIADPAVPCIAPLE